MTPLLTLKQIDLLPSVSLDNRGQMPYKAAVYFVLNHREILYVGSSSCLHQRWTQHHKKQQFSTYPDLKSLRLR